MKFYRMRNILFASLLSSLAACSSDDSGGGSAGNATITADNQEQLATAGTEGVKQGRNNSELNVLAARTPGGDPVRKLSATISSRGPMAEEIPGICVDGGSVDATGTETNAVITFSNCNIGGGLVMDGVVTTTSSASGSVTTTTLTYTNFTVSFQGETETINLTATCTTDTSGASVTSSCSYDSTGTGVDGRTYTVTNVTVSGDDFNGWSVSATITDPDNGQITITTNTPVTFNCTNGQPDSGSITVSDGSSTMTVTYNDCDSFTVDFDGSTTTYNW